MRLEFDCKIRNLRLKSTENGTGKYPTAEIRKVGKEAECVIALWRRNEDGYSLIFIGDRPFNEDIEPVSFMDMARIGQHLLDQYFEEIEENTLDN